MTVHIVHLDADPGLATTFCGRSDRIVDECSRCAKHDESNAGPWVQCGAMLHREKRLTSMPQAETEQLA